MSIGADDPVLDRAVRLFTFLAQSQQLRTPRIHDLASYATDGAVHWLSEVPEHPAVAIGNGDDDLLLAVERLPRLEPPVPGPEWLAWLDEPVDDPTREPRLRARLRADDLLSDDHDPDVDDEPDPLLLSDHPEVVDAHRAYLEHWRDWAERDRRDAPVRAAYRDLFATHVAADTRPEELELVVGVGLLTWKPERHAAVRRHLLTTAAAITFDDDSGRLTVTIADKAAPTAVELDMLDPRLLVDPEPITRTEAEIRETEFHPLDRERGGEFIRRLVHPLAADAAYRDGDSASAPSAQPSAALSPALVLRKRSQQGLVDLLRGIAERIRTERHVPAGVRPLLDPDSIPAADTGTGHSDGALVQVDDDPFLPLLVNETQLKVLHRVDNNAQTLIQGPPGTGKTHTAAILLSHLLARGKRVLVTAHTDRALKEVRQKLPEPIRPLAVSVVGNSREDLADLRMAVERIASRAGEHDPEGAAQEIARLLGAIEGLRQRRADLRRQLLAAREREVQLHDIHGFRGTLASIARELEYVRGRHRWLDDFVDGPAGEPPLSNEVVLDWHRRLLDTDLIADEPDAIRPSVVPEQIPDPAELSRMLDADSAATRYTAAHGQLHRHRAYSPIRALDHGAQQALTDMVGTLFQRLERLGRRGESWIGSALSDILADRAEPWSVRRGTLADLADRTSAALAQLDPATTVTVNGELAGLDRIATELLAYLDAGNSVKLGRDGTPRATVFTARPVRQAEPLFERIRVNDSPPTTRELVVAFLSWREAERLLGALDDAWPAGASGSSGLRARERLQWHRAEITVLDEVLTVSLDLRHANDRCDSLRVPRPNWADPRDVQAFLSLSDAAQAADAADARREVLEDLAAQLAAQQRLPDTAPVVGELLVAVRSRDVTAYATAHRRLHRLHVVRAETLARDETARRLRTEIPGLTAAVSADPAAEEWPERLGAFEQAWNCAATASWIAARPAPDVNAVQSRITGIENEIRERVTELAAVRAWTHAVGRLGQRARTSLEQYASLVRKFGKTGGAHRAQKIANIRDAMDRSRPAVPVWIMPLYRIADQLRIEPDMFDVVVVDEASQAGLEASFLQYLAPRIVVIGDDKQVSPSAVGVEQQQLLDLSRQYLYDETFHANWEQPTNSLFDIAKMYFNGMLTLTEHRRCVPEIIEFSNRVAYEPAGVTLNPVRQVGAERLPPVCPVYVDGRETGSTSRWVNRAEVDAIVEQIEKCIADPGYDDLTFGVISLLGTAQAKEIEQKLIDRLSPEEWDARDLRCGDAADFQGSERNVMFLSMVAAPGRRHTALTGEQHVQRYNVAASRAMDQMWVFHSLRRDELTNPEDMRFRLLDHCYGVIGRTDPGHGALTSPVGDETLVAPFPTLFQQRVADRLLAEGYAVVPRYEVPGYTIDLVVVGTSARLAVTCDGDVWRGPDAYLEDMARQRELERCNWNFVRILESEFVLAPERALAPLRRRLTELGIRPLGSEPSASVTMHADAPGGTTAQYPVSSVSIAARPQHDIGERSTPADDPHAVQPDDTGEPDPVLDEEAVPRFEVHDTAPHRDSTQDDTPSTNSTSYRRFEGSVPPVETASQAALMDGIVKIVSVEGPMVGHRLHSVYVRSADGHRVGSRIASALNSAVTAAVRKGLVVGESPLGEVGVKPRTYRLPDQPSALLRELGPRTFEQIPPAELAAALEAEALTLGWTDRTALYRSVIGRYGLGKLGSVIRSRLDTVARLVEP